MLRIIVLVFFVLIALGIGSATGLIMAALEGLPSIEALEDYKPNTITRVYSQEGEVIAEFYQERRIPVPIKSVPRYVIDAFVSTEDANFYRHHGIDLRGIVRAAIHNLKAKESQQGGSTITQQLARILFLTAEKTLSRKIKEAALALKIEKRYTKDEILELYLNQIYLGQGSYGVEAAAETYFGKGVGQVNLAEAALLAALPRGPTLYNPNRNPRLAERRRLHVLNRMVEEGHITKEEARQATEYPIHYQSLRGRVSAGPYFVDVVRQYLEERYGDSATYLEGMEVHTTLNAAWQRRAEEALRQGLMEVSTRRGFRFPLPPISEELERISRNTRYLEVGQILAGQVEKVARDRLWVRVKGATGVVPAEGMKWTRVKDAREVFRPGDGVAVQILTQPDELDQKEFELRLLQEPEVEGSFLAIDPRRGAVRAMVGGYSFERSQFNRAIQAARQPGSAFKPFIMAAAIEHGSTLADIVYDSPMIFQDPQTRRIWKPKNYKGEFQGPITLRYALEQSVNLASVRVLDKVGIDAVIDVARRMGIESYLAPYMSLALGTSDLTLQELVVAYGTLANGGIRSKPYLIETITDRRGQILEEAQVEASEVLSADVAYLTTYMMRGVIDRGTGRKAKRLNRPMAGKTGTTNEFEDTWFVGFTPNLVAGAWVGLDNHDVIGRGETGASAAAPIWIAFMESVLADLPEEDFPVPENIVFRKIDARTGLLANEACEDVIDEAFRKGTEPTQYCPHSLDGALAQGSLELQLYHLQ